MKSKRLSVIVLLLSAVVAGYAQGGTDSPYSQYGLGILADQSQGFSWGMNGVGVALRQGNIANTLNPAAYSAIDSLTMVFDIAMSGQITNFKEGGASSNAKQAYFEYAVGTFRLLPNVGVSFGLLPYSSVGYKYSSEKFLDTTNGTVTETYSGSGGLRRLLLGAGWRVFKPLSIGVNMSYLWGDYNRSVTTSSTTYINALSKTYSASVNSYMVDAGLQWEQPMGRHDVLTLGATVGVGHKLGADPECSIVNQNSVTGTRDTTTLVVNNGLSLPTTYSLGLGWNHRGKLFVEADATLQKWAGVDMPSYDAGSGSYALRSGQLKDRYKVAVGADYVPGAMSRSFFKRVHYRVGAGYSTPYITVNGQDGPKEVSVSAGIGLPLQNSWNTRGNMRPVLNVSAGWAHTSATGLINENVFRINLGLTFNERWFAKWKVD